MVPTYAGLRHSSSRRMFPLEPDPIAVRVVCDHAAPFDNLKHFLLHPPPFRDGDRRIWPAPRPDACLGPHQMRGNPLLQIQFLPQTAMHT